MAWHCLCCIVWQGRDRALHGECQYREGYGPGTGYSSVVWHSSLTEKEINSLERVQKSAVKVILKNNYKSYEDALEFLNLDSLQIRRKKQCLKFAKDCLKHEKMKELFPLNVKNTQLKIRFKETYKVNKANTERYKQSAIPYLQNLLNEDEQNRNKEKKRYI